MSKKKNNRRCQDNQAIAILKNLKSGCKKTNQMLSVIRRKKVGNALNILEFSRRKIALQIKKTLESAIANAENNHNIDIDDLVVQQAFVGKGITLKRWRPRARGRTSHINKKFSRVTILVGVDKN